MAALTLIGGNVGSSDGWVWDYECDCGLDYRVRSTSAGATLWPAAGTGFNDNFLKAGQACLKCAQPLSLEGCTIKTPMQSACDTQ